MTAARVELCVGAVIIVDDALLLIQRATDPGRGQWSLPGGRVEPGETMHEALVREVLEETGLDVVCDQPVGWVERISADHHFVIVDFAATVVSSAIAPMAASDAAEAAFVPIWRVSEIDLVDGLLEFLADHDIVEAFA